MKQLITGVLLGLFSTQVSAQEVEKLIRAAFQNDKDFTAIPGQVAPLAAYYKLESKEITTGKAFIGMLRKKSIDMRNVQFDSAFYYAGQMLLTSKVLQFPEGIQISNHLLGKNYWLAGELVRADSFADEAIHVAHANNLPNKEAASLDLKGSIARERGDFEKALECHRQAASISAAIKDTMSEALAISNVAVALDCQGHYDEAIEAYFKALKVIEKSTDTVFIANTLLSIGALYSDNNYTDKAIEYSQKALALHRAIGDLNGVAKALVNIGEAQTAKGVYPDALKNLKEAELFALKTADPFDLAAVYSALQTLCFKQGNATDAAHYLQKALDAFRVLDAKPEIANLYLVQAEMFNKSGNFESARTSAHAAFALSDSIQSIKIKHSALEALASIYENLGRPAQALQYFKQAVVLGDSLKGIAVQEKINSMEIAYETEKKERIIQTQKASLQEQRLWNGIIAMFLLIAILLALMQYRSNLQKKEINAGLAQQNSSLKALNTDLEDRIASLSTTPADVSTVGELTVILSGQEKTVLRLVDIVYIKADGNTVDIFTADGKKHTEWQRLKSYVDLLEPAGLFIQTHRSYLINYRYITHRKSNEITLTNGAVVRIGNTLKREVDKWLDERLGGRVSDVG